MRWITFIFTAIGSIVGIYALSMYYFVDESKYFTIEKEVNYPIDKVFPQFNNFQNFTRWNNYFSDSRKLSVQYFEPYEGIGSSMVYSEPDKNRKGEMYIKYSNPNTSIRYQLFEKGESNPTLIDVKFKSLGNEKTRIIWVVHTPKQPLMKRSANLFTEADFVNNLDKSMLNFANIMSNKVERDHQMASIKYDSLIVEQEEGKLLLGINANASNKKNALIRDIVMTHNKVFNFVTMDLAKREDEFGFPILVSEAQNYKDKEVSYFYGIPLSKRASVSDNNFIFKTINPSKYYTIYYKGNYNGRGRAIQQLLNKAKKDTMRNGELQQIFLENPSENDEVILKLALPVYK